jgi:uncharacterized protein involved in exopolysaccharide biosynthesis
MKEKQQNTLLPNSVGSAAPLVSSYNVPGPQLDAETGAGDGVLPIGHYVWILRRHIWKILALVAVCVISTFIVSKRLQPIYESTVVINVDRQAPSAVVGVDSDRAAPAYDSDQYLATQIRLIQSDAVLRPVVEKFDLLHFENQLGSLDSTSAQKKRVHRFRYNA